MMQKIFWAFLFLAGGHSAGVAGEKETTLIERVQKEYPPALDKLENRYGLMHGRAHYHGKKPIKGEAERDVDYELDFAFVPGSAKISVVAQNLDLLDVDGGKSHYQTVLGLNPQYAFTVIRHRPKDEFALKDLTEDQEQGRTAITNNYGGMLQCAVSLNRSPISRSFKRNIFRISSVAELEENECPASLLVQFSLVPAPGTPRQKNSLDVAGWLVVSPGEGWILREYGGVYSAGDGSSVTKIGKITYARSLDGHLDPVKLIQQTYVGRVERQRTGPPVTGLELDLDQVKFAASPEESFRLPAFGLPEIDLKNTKGASTGGTLPLFAFASIGFGVAGGLKYLSSRLKRA